MRESDFILLYRITAGIEVILYGACMAAFLRPFLDEGAGGGRSTRRKCLFVLVDYIFIFFLGAVFSFRGWLCMLLLTALLAVCRRFLGIGREALFLLGVLFFCTRHLSLMAAQSLNHFTYRLFLAGANTPEKVFLGAALNHICIEALTLLLFALMLRGLVLVLGRRPFALHVRELCYLLLTPVTGILFVRITLQLLIVADGDSIFQLYEQVPMAVGIVPLLAALFYAGTLAAIALCQKNMALQEERGRHFVEQQQLAGIQERLAQVEEKYAAVDREIKRLEHTGAPPSPALDRLLEGRGEPPCPHGARLLDLLRRPRLDYAALAPFDPERPALPPEIREQVEISVKYQGYIDRQNRQVEELRRLEDRPLPPDMDYLSIQGLRLEARQKLDKIRPLNLGQASRVSGVSPADVTALMIYLERGSRDGDHNL